MTMQKTARSVSETENGIRKTHQERVYDFVKTKIMHLEIKPGQYISDFEIAKILDVSRTPVREALRRLEQEGILINTGHGWKVYILTLKDIKDIFELKDQLEGMIARKAAESEDDELREKLKNTWLEMKQAAEINDFSTWQKHDLEIHRIIFEMCPNKRTTEIIQGLNDQWYRLRIGLTALGNRIQQSTNEHERVVQAILSRDGEQAEISMRAHLNNVKEDLIRVLNFVLNFVDGGV